GNIGKTIEIEFIRYLQTSAGKMMFAKQIARTPSAPRTLRQQPKQQSKQQPRRQGSSNTRRQPQTKQSDDRPKNTNNRRPRRKETGEDRLVRLANK
ncbi:MAG: hypothetical protein LBL84_00840, partial [Candidatus Nomurabacteria bacterium]|nr:hypothetical protein [Candidatus Nomurabacteria bacterium]